MVDSASQAEAHRQLEGICPGMEIEVSGSDFPEQSPASWRYFGGGREVSLKGVLRSWSRPVASGRYTLRDWRPAVIALLGGSSGDALTDALHRFGFRVLLVIGRPGEAGYDRAEQVLIHDLRDTRFVAEQIAQQADFLLMGNTHLLSIRIADLLCREFSFPVNIPVDPLWLEKDKIRMKRKILDEGLITPPFFVLESIEQFDALLAWVTTMPCVVKPAMDSCQAECLHSWDQVRKAAHRILKMGDRVLVESFLPGWDFTVPVAAQGSQVRAYGVIYYCKAKEYGLTGFPVAEHGPMTPEQEQRACRAAEHLVRVCGFQGIPRVDMIWPAGEDQPSILEVNGVPVLGYHGHSPPFFRAAGLDLAYDMICLMMGEPIPVLEQAPSRCA